MKVRSLFFTQNGTLRAIWRITFFAIAASACGFVVPGLFQGVVDWIYRVTGLRSVSDEGWIEVGALLAAQWLALRQVDRRPWSDVAMDRSAARPIVLARGFLLGILPIAVPILGLIAVGWLVRTAGTAEPANSSGIWLAGALRVSIFLLPAALAEELLARGYIFSVIRDAAGWRWSLALTSIGFGLLHLANDGATVGSILAVTLAGVFLGVVRLATASLYAAWMAHFAWNWTMAVAFHTAVSGYPLEAPAYRYVDAGPNWATGGAWGPEGGVPATIGMAMVVAYLVARQRQREGGKRWPSG